MKWADRRTLLLEICGDISDADVIAGDKELAPLIEILKKLMAANIRQMKS